MAVILVITSAVCRPYRIEGFPVRVAAVCRDNFPQIFGYMHHIFHELLRIFKYTMIHSLKDIMLFVAGGRFVCKQKGIVDMAVSIRPLFFQRAFYGKLCDCVFNDGIGQVIHGIILSFLLLLKSSKYIIPVPYGRGKVLFKNAYIQKE